MRLPFTPHRPSRTLEDVAKGGRSPAEEEVLALQSRALVAGAVAVQLSYKLIGIVAEIVEVEKQLAALDRGGQDPHGVGDDARSPGKVVDLDAHRAHSHREQLEAARVELARRIDSFLAERTRLRERVSHLVATGR